MSFSGSLLPTEESPEASWLPWSHLFSSLHSLCPPLASVFQQCQTPFSDCACNTGCSYSTCTHCLIHPLSFQDSAYLHCLQEGLPLAPVTHCTSLWLSFIIRLWALRIGTVCFSCISSLAPWMYSISAECVLFVSGGGGERVVFHGWEHHQQRPWGAAQWSRHFLGKSKNNISGLKDASVGQALCAKEALYVDLHFVRVLAPF